MARSTNTILSATEDTIAALSVISESVAILLLRNAATFTDADTEEVERIISALARSKQYQLTIRHTASIAYQEGTRR